MSAHSAPTNAVPAPLHGLVWRYGRTLPDAPRGLPTGFAALDRVLPQHGWTAEGLNELIGNEQGVGEFSLLLPALAAASAERRNVLLANPPFMPYAPALADSGIILAHLIVVRNADPDQLYWAAEQALRSKACGAVVAWSHEAARPLSDLLLRRLQVAAATGHAAGFLFRPRRASEHPSPAAMRVVYAAADGALDLTVLKARGMPGTPHVRVEPWRHPWAVRRPAHQRTASAATPSATPHATQPTRRPSQPPRHPQEAYEHALDRSSSPRPFIAGDHARTAPAHAGRDH